MADFLPAVAYMLQNEGGYANTPGDHGGETYCGIARNYWPTWGGWPIIDGMKPAKPAMHDPQLASFVSDFYKQMFWKFADIEDQTLANKLLDTAVLMGKGRCITFLQQAIVACQRVIQVDGVCGPATIAAANCIEPAYLLRTFVQEMLEQINKIVAKDPSQAKFAEGWKARAQRV